MRISGVLGDSPNKMHENALWPQNAYLVKDTRRNVSDLEIFSHRNHCFFQFVVVSLRQEVIDDLSDEKMQKRVWKEGRFEQGI